MLAWANDVNYSNNEMAAEFARWIARVRPDVVHFHNLQGFGGALLSIAAAAGAATVVTTHDMWWWCARQFLVDPKLRPCSTVVDCGVCPCEVDNAWLIARNRRLAAHLRNADLVLAPSSTMIDLLSANGVDPTRLALDENPTPGIGGAAGLTGPFRRNRPLRLRRRQACGEGRPPRGAGRTPAPRSAAAGRWTCTGSRASIGCPNGSRCCRRTTPTRSGRAGRLRRAGDVLDHAGVLLAADPRGVGGRLRRHHR